MTSARTATTAISPVVVVDIYFMWLCLQVKLLGRDVPSTISSPIRTKFVSYIVFLIVVFANMSMEVVMHSLMSHQEGMYKLIMLYEVGM